MNLNKILFYYIFNFSFLQNAAEQSLIQGKSQETNSKGKRRQYLNGEMMDQKSSLLQSLSNWPSSKSCFNFQTPISFSKRHQFQVLNGFFQLMFKNQVMKPVNNQIGDKQNTNSLICSDEQYAQLMTDLFSGTTMIPRCKGAKTSKQTKEAALDAKQEALDRLHRILKGDKGFLKELIRKQDRMDDLFIGMKSCLSSLILYQIQFGQVQSVDKSHSSNSVVADKVVDVILAANTLLFEILPEILSYDEVEKQTASLIPSLIENLGSPKAVVRKSTHKCIGTYVKLTKKLEFVLIHIIHTGLDNSNSRTRQHSMLVLPALLSLKPTAIEKENPEMKELVQAVIKRIQSDSSDIVSKTGKKLILELQKCYPTTFKSQQIDTLANFDLRQISYAVLSNDEGKLKELLSKPLNTAINHDDVRIGPSAHVAMQNSLQVEKKPVIEVPPRTKQFSSQISSSPTKQPIIVNQSALAGTSHSHHKPSGSGANNIDSLNKAGRDIMNTASKAVVLESNVLESSVQAPEAVGPAAAKYPVADNGLLFGFLQEEILNQLDERRAWQDRTAAIEHIDDKLNVMLSDHGKKSAFLPFIGTFLGMILVYIKDINFKICLTAVNITKKLLVLNINCFNQHKTQLTTSLIEKLSDSKVVIRQAVLKCCGFIIANSANGLMAIAYHSIGYLQHTNWHVREGILHLLADCIIAQGQMDELEGPAGARQETMDPNHFAFNSHFISEMCTLARTEAKSKIQQMVIDCLALCLEISPNRQKTEQIMMWALGLSPESSGKGGQEQEFMLINSIKQRQNRDYLPAMQIDGTIEFKPPGVISDVLPPSPKKQLDGSAGVPPSEQQHYLQMRYQQQRIQSNQPLPLSQEPPQQQNALPSIANQGTSQTRQSPARKVDASPYAQMLERNRQYSVTVNKDQSSRPQKMVERPQAFQTPNVQNKEIKPENQLTSQFTRGPQPQSLMKQPEQLFGAGLQPGNSELTPGSARKDDRAPVWMPQVSGQPPSGSDSRSPYAMARPQSLNQKQQQLVRLNGTASSAATLIDDGRSIKTTAAHTAQVAYNNQKSGLGQNGQNMMASNNQTHANPQRQNHANISGVGDSHFQVQSTQDASTKLGYNPEGHNNKPRNIYSNELRQRTIDGEILSQSSAAQMGNTIKNDFISIQQSPKVAHDLKQLTGQIGRASQGMMNSGISVQQRNMSQSSGAPGGFNIDKTQINQRLQLLKSTFKYKNASEIDQNDELKTFDNSERLKYGGQTKAESEQNPRQRNERKITKDNNNFMIPGSFENEIQQSGNPQITHNSFGLSNLSSSKINASGLKEPRAGEAQSATMNFKRNNMNSKAQGPIKATSGVVQQDRLNTIHMDERQMSEEQQHRNLTVKNQMSAPPLPRKPSTMMKKGSQNKMLDDSPGADMKRIHSVQMQSNQKREELAGEHVATTYNAPEEPVPNPEVALRQCLEQLKSDDWQKIFDGLNMAKRLASFHKDVIQASGSAKELIKLVVKHTDNLRSQVAKNSCMALQVFYSELPQRDLDAVVDVVLAALLRKAADTNHFVSEQGDKALKMVIHAVGESKVFVCLQAIPNKGNAHKHKICLAYCELIAKLGNRVTTFKECVSLVKAVVNMLGEGAQDVRNAGKLGILTMKNNLPTPREFDGLMMRCGLSDRQLEQVRKVVEQGDLEQLGNAMGTKYGQSMRGSSLDSRGDYFRRTPNKAASGLGSDGFTQSSFNMQQTFVSQGGVSASPSGTSAQGFGATSNSHAFKKRQPSVSKPIDPRVYEQFRHLVDQCQLPDWQKRLETLDLLNDWIASHSTLIKNNQHAKFIQLVDIKCKLIQDNNAKVQAKAIAGFKDFLRNDDLRQLLDVNITMITQAITHNWSSTNSTVKASSDELFCLLEDTTQNINQIVQPMVAQINLPTSRAKAYLLERLIRLVPRLDQQIIERHLAPLGKQSHKLQQEATTNPKLREQLRALEEAIAK